MSGLTLLALLVTGGVTGAIGALMGIGGGVFLIPTLVLWFGIPIGKAAGAGLVAIIATSCAAASVNLDKGLVNIPLALTLETATVFGTLVGGALAGLIPPHILILIFGLLLAGVSILLWRGRSRGSDHEQAETSGPFAAQYHDPAANRTVSYSVRRLPTGLGVGFFAGGLSGLLGIGGGVLKVPALHLWCGIPMKGAAATSNYMIGMTGAAGALFYFFQGRLDPVLSGVVAMGVLLGSRAGALVSRRIPDRHLRRAFALLTVFLAVQMLRRALG
jgi:uncharacterized membrane protein YfcA